jgi:MinD superfamily P-loop ATPase
MLTRAARTISGVGKATANLNLRWMLAEQDYKTLIFDADSQCTLTASVPGYNSVDDAEFFSRMPLIVMLALV